MIEIREVTKQYGRRLALGSVSMTVHPGEVTLLLGANGAGKSTLLRCILGITDFEGEIRVAGRDPLIDGQAVRSCIGYMPQSGGLHPDLTVEGTMRLYAAIRRASGQRCAALLDEAGLSSHASTKVGELSGGMRQRLGFALALLTDPQILVLDEPSASLDVSSREWLAGRLRQVAAEGRTVLVSTHGGVELMDAGHRRIVLEDGHLLPGGDRPLPAGSASSRGESPPVSRLAAGRIAPIIRKEVTDAVCNRWLIGYAALLGALGGAATLTGLDSTSGLALQAFGRTTATLMNLCLLLCPLVAVLMGAASIAGERDRGTLEHLLAQPLTRTTLLLGKHAGLLAALALATLAGFLPAGILIGLTAGVSMVGHFLLFPAIAVLAGAAMAGVGLLISVSSRSAVQAQGTAVFAWFGFVLLYDLLLMGSLAMSGMPAEWLAAALVANPVDAARVLGVLALEPDLYLLGPAGAYLAARLSHAGAAGLLLAVLALWATVPVIGAVVRFALPSGRRRTGKPAPARALSTAEEVTFS
jgi:ABC-type Mn2+/Zn2+ transport system ATPase subunit/ABC-type transport system involved in multi-copper enzyme maturation permease subunit